MLNAAAGIKAQIHLLFSTVHKALSEADGFKFKENNSELIVMTDSYLTATR
ncbi:hypothetical protein GCM10023188_14840 [Pontibacter saemangeumensis]|uniref:Uncharacterized protein n=1 Tax=Pontibacter saemangeumensis TaxID=1084525 RepID=A0ABP8LJQ0_9BACT